MKIEKIGKRNIVFKYELPEWDLNLHLILGQRYNYLIDTGLGSKSVAPIIDYLGNSPKPLIVVNTHYHWDHIWGNHCFSECSIVSHSYCRELAAENWAEMLQRNESYIRGEVKLCLPNLVFDSCLDFPDDKIRIFYTPGHTVDCISVFDGEDKVLNVGDNIGDTLQEIVPVLKTETALYLKTIHMYQELDVVTCISGHNQILGKDVFEAIENTLHAEQKE